VICSVFVYFTNIQGPVSRFNHEAIKNVLHAKSKINQHVQVKLTNMYKNNIIIAREKHIHSLYKDEQCCHLT